jgi:hypothetical protein
VTADLVAICIDANDPQRLSRFWAGVLNRQVASDGLTLLPRDEAAFSITFRPTDARKDRQNQLHLDLTSTSLEDQQHIVARALELGARHIDIGQGPEDEHVVLADPEGNEFCVIEPGNNFLAGCGFIGAINCDGSQDVGYFWSAALDWPLIWDQDEETAVQSPSGGPKMSWGGPPVAQKTGKNRIHLHVAPRSGNHQAEVVRLLSLGATRLDLGQAAGDWVVMADPDGNEFCVLAAR